VAAILARSEDRVEQEEAAMSKSAKSKDGREATSAGQLWLRLPGLVRAALCGARYAHLVDREALRAGHLASSLVLGGRRVAVSRPRVRSADGHELKLPSWREWSARDPLEQRAMEQMVLGVSTRRSARSLEPLPEAVTLRGISKRAVSERFVYGTERKLAQLMSRELRGLSLLALLIDGVHFAEHVVLAAVGVDQHGAKHVLGLREGLEETLTVMRLGLPENLERVLSSTNLIENLFSRVREIGPRVKPWQSGTMLLRWTAAGVLEAERGFRKLAGYRAMPTLVAALRAHDTQFNGARPGVDETEKAA